MKKIDVNYYPGWTRKAITFTIDDGNIPLDKKFISIVKPYGIKGTFNLMSPDLNRYSADDYREIYLGFGISNHCKLHPFALTPDKEREISDESFNIETADENKLYRIDGMEGIYHYHAPNGWRKVATPEVYTRLVFECHNDLENVFGKGSVTTFVWPYTEQHDDTVKKYLKDEMCYAAVRKVGATEDRTGFAVPVKRMEWSYNANHKNLTEVAEKYEKYSDDGELKFFSFGVHSHDYERDDCWDVLVSFAKKYGNRPEDFYYASVEDIFSYYDATQQIEIKDKEVINPTEFDVYAMIENSRVIIPKKSKLTI